MTINHSTVSIIGAAIGAAAGISGCEKAPACIKNSTLNKTANFTLNWEAIVTYEGEEVKLDAIPLIRQFCMKLAQTTSKLCKKESPFYVMGGDHACAIGTWSGVSHAIKQQGELGLIWIDAHLDAHTPQTSPSGNIHGMPVATLLGHGDNRLTHLLCESPVLKPEHLVLIGIRSYEKAELALLESLGAKIFYIDEVKTRGFDKILNESISYLESQTHAFGISLDLDALERPAVPGVGTPVKNGISISQLLTTFKSMNKDKLICTEITEFNPTLDQNHVTEKTVFRILESLIGN